MLALRLPPDLEERLGALAEASGRSTAEYALEALAEYIADVEDAQVAEKRLVDLRGRRNKNISLQELMERYGLAD